MTFTQEERKERHYQRVMEYARRKKEEGSEYLMKCAINNKRYRERKKLEFQRLKELEAKMLADAEKENISPLVTI